MGQSLYTFYIDDSYIPLVSDIIRLSIIFLTIQFLSWINDTKIPFANFIFCYSLVGVCVYWGIFKKLVIFRNVREISSCKNKREYGEVSKDE